MDIRSREGLYQGDDRYETVVRAMAEGVVVQDADSVILACNQAAETLLGLTADQMMGRTSLDPRWRAIHEDGSPFPGETHPVPVTLQTGKALRDVVMGVHKPDGTLTWISINSEPLFRSGDDKPFAAICTFSDITQRKVAEDALRLNEERYRRIIETTLEGVWMIDLEGATILANQRMAEMLACTLEELARSKVWDFIEEADRAAAAERLAARARGIGEVHDFRLRRRDGTHLDTSMATSSITLPDGAIGALAMVRDVSRERRMEAELRETNERLELALAVGQMGTWEWTVGTTLANGSRQLREILGLDASVQLTDPEKFYATVHPDDITALRASFDAYISAGANGQFVNNFRILRPDGTVRWVRSAGGSVTTPAGEKRILGTLVDFTESRALEQQLQQAQQLESIGRLAGGVAHDFNNLLTAILACVTIAEMANAPELAEEVSVIRTAAERGADLTRQLLAFARKQVIELTTLDLNTIIRNLAGVLRRLVGEDVILDLVLADELWATRAGASQLEQVIVNLAVNARDAMPKGGPLRIATSNVTVEGSHEAIAIRPGEYVVLTVTDRGTGIDARSLPHVFEPFYTTKHTGTGLGLASSYGIVQQLGGDIRVQSELGVGTTFTVYFPRERSAVQTVSAAPAIPSTRRASSTVLLVEDDELLRRVIARGLVESGYQILVAGDGEEALAVASRHDGPIDVVVTDVVMPKLSGRELAAQMRAIRPSTKVLYTSGYSDQIIARRGVLAPGQHYIPKPYTIETLERRIDELLG